MVMNSHIQFCFSIKTDQATLRRLVSAAAGVLIIPHWRTSSVTAWQPRVARERQYADTDGRRWCVRENRYHWLCISPAANS